MTGAMHAPATTSTHRPSWRSILTTVSSSGTTRKSLTTTGTTMPGSERAWCEDVTVEKQTPVTEPAAGLFFGGDQVAKHPPGGEAYGHLDARDPVTGERKWSVNFKYPPIGSVLSTGGGLVVHGDVEGVVRAYDADSGEELWHFRTGSGHRGGPISYAVNGKQYIAVPTGLGSLVLGLYPALWPEVADFPSGGALFVFSLK